MFITGQSPGKYILTEHHRKQHQLTVAVVYDRPARNIMGLYGSESSFQPDLYNNGFAYDYQVSFHQGVIVQSVVVTTL